MTKSGRNITVLLFVLTTAHWFVAVHANAQLPPGQERGYSLWADSFKRAQQIAAERRRFVLIHFWNDNCPPCRAVEANVFRVPEVERAMEVNYVPVRVHVQDEPALAQRYNITRWPTDVVVTPDGQEIFRTVSPQDPQQYISFLDRVATHARVGMTAPRDAIEPQQTNETNSARSSMASEPAFGPRQPADRPGVPQQNDFYDQRVRPGQPTDSYASYPQQPAAPQQDDRSFVPQNNPYGNDPGLGARAPDRGFDPRDRDSRWSPGAPAPGMPTSQPSLPIQNNFVGPTPGAAIPNTPPSPKANPTVAMDGYCPVTLVEQRRWQKADARFGAVHRDRTYLFASAEEQQRFLANPDKYSPMLSGFDPVRYVEQGQLVEGKRQHGVTYGNQMYLFSDEASLQRFWGQPQAYTRVVHEAMRMSSTPNLQR